MKLQAVFMIQFHLYTSDKQKTCLIIQLKYLNKHSRYQKDSLKIWMIRILSSIMALVPWQLDSKRHIFQKRCANEFGISGIFSIFEQFEKNLDYKRLQQPNYLTHIWHRIMGKHGQGLAHIFRLVPCGSICVSLVWLRMGCKKQDVCCGGRVTDRSPALFRTLWLFTASYEKPRSKSKARKRKCSLDGPKVLKQ